MIIGLDQGRERIEPIKELLIDSHTAAAATWSKFVREQPEMALPFDASGRAKFIHLHLQMETTRRVTPVAGVQPTDCLGFFAIRIEPDVLLRLKYIGQDGTPHNYPTEQQKLLARQTYDSDMLASLGGAGVTAPTLLTCGYTLDELEIGRVEIRCDCTGRLPWSFHIFGEDVMMEPLVLDGMADDTKPAKVASSRKAQRKDDGQANLG